MSFEPFILSETNNFLIIYKPPFYKVDIPNNYDKIKTYDDYNKLKNPKPLQLFIKFMLLNKNIIVNGPEYNICHRYDLETSGGLLVSKKEDKFQEFRDIISDKSNTTKIYITLVNGIIKIKNGYINYKIKCDKHSNSMNCYIDSKFGKYSCSYYNVISYFDNYTLIHIRIFTGRTHQIRVHMNALGHPVVSDDKYITDSELLRNNRKIINRLFLHNVFLKFTYNNENYSYTIPLSFDLLNTLLKFNKTKKIYNFNKLLKIKCNQSE